MNDTAQKVSLRISYAALGIAVTLSLVAVKAIFAAGEAAEKVKTNATLIVAHERRLELAEMERKELSKILSEMKITQAVIAENVKIIKELLVK